MAAPEPEEERDSGPPKGARRGSAGPVRTCIATRIARPADEMIRFVVGPDGAAIPDLKRRLPGRGVWVTGTHQAIEAAVARNAFSRGFRKPVAAPHDLAAQVEGLLVRSALDALGIAHKAGLLAAGFSKAEAVLNTTRAVALVQADEAAPDGARKLANAGGSELPVLKFAGAQLDLALGRSNVVHAALLAGPASETLLARYRCLERFRGGELV